jgi:hypothetical protein
MLLATVTTILPLCLPGNDTFCAPGFGDFLADTRVRRLKGKRDDNIEVYFVDTICNNGGYK